MSNVRENNEQSRSIKTRSRKVKVDAIRERVEHARDIVETIRERAELAFREKPYLVPVAAGAVGLGIGMLIGSKLTRLLVFTAVGTILSDAFGGEIKRIAG